MASYQSIAITQAGYICQFLQQTDSLVTLAKEKHFLRAAESALPEVYSGRRAYFDLGRPDARRMGWVATKKADTTVKAYDVIGDVTLGGGVVVLAY